ncbi:MAG TPA: hypothetical protein ENJ56_08255, partial [Anaerolineae bacterium]|nr:hypothetical protein [Anaerolineae bacterium]
MVDTLIGQKIGRYEIIERIGHGGMSEVFKACCADDGGYVAIKLLHAFHADDPSFLHRFTREARAMSQLDHPSIVHVYDYDTKIEKPYIAMEYLSGGTLKTKFRELKRRGEILPLTQAVRIVLEIADALAYAHSYDMVHRDIKPANIIFNAEGRAVLTDFGIVKTLGATQHTTTGAMIGTPAYMSPEQGLGRAGDMRSDVYALGVLFFQMATGRLPYDADKPLAVVLKHINEPIPYPTAINPDLPVPLEAIIMRALAKNPLDRFNSAADMTRAIRNVVENSLEDWAARVPRHLLMPLSLTANSSRRSFARTRITNSPAVRRRQGDRNPLARDSNHRKPHRMRAVGILLSLLGILAIATFLLNPGIINALRTPIKQQIEPQPDGLVDNPLPEATEPFETAVAINISQNECTFEATLTNSYTSDEAVKSAVSAENFQMNWVLHNTGNCPLEAGMRFGYESGEEFGGPIDIVLAQPVAADEDVWLSTMLTAPAEPGVYNAVWRLYGEDGNPYGRELTFDVEVEGFDASTPTGDEVEGSEPIGTADEPLDFVIYVQSCDFGETGWHCLVYVVPAGGSGGNYTIRIDDQGQLT